MLNLTQALSREQIAARVREIVAEQMAMSAFEVKLEDDINVDLCITGDDVNYLLAEIHREFGTDLSELSAYAELYFTPEIEPSDFRFATYLLICLIALFASFLSPIWPFPFLPTMAYLALAAFCTWKLVCRYQAAHYEPKLLSFTVNDLVDAVVRGKWTPPEDMWQRIERMGQKKVRN